MANYSGQYENDYLLSDYTMMAIYTWPEKMRSLPFEPVINDSVSGGKKLKSGEVYEVVARTDVVADEVSVYIKADAEGKIRVELVEDGLVVGGATNSQANVWEEVVFAPSSVNIKLRVKVLPVGSVGKAVIGYFKDVKLTMGSSVYGLDDEFRDFELISGSGGSGGNNVWVKVNGEWKQAKCSVI